MVPAGFEQRKAAKPCNRMAVASVLLLEDWSVLKFTTLLALCGMFCALTNSLSAQNIGGDAAESAPATAGPTPAAEVPATAAKPGHDRVLGVLPNYRTAELTDVYQPISVKRKFYIGYKDSTDYPIYGLSAVLAGLGQWTDQHPEYGQGLKGFGKRYAATISDQLIGNFLTESIMPSLLHEDPRYFRLAHGSVLKRTGYAASRVFVTKTDHGNTMFNFAELTGNAISASIGNAYYPGETHLNDNVERFYSQLATDAISQILKEFWPDIKKKFWRQKSK